MEELKLLVNSRYYFPASLDERGLEEIEDSPSEDYIFIEGVKVPLFPGPTIDEKAGLKRRFDPEHFNQIRESAIKQIQRRFQSAVNVDRITEFKRNYSFMYNVITKVMPNFIGYERRFGVEESQGPVSFEESQTIDVIKRNVNPDIYRRYEKEVKEVFNVFQIERVGDFLKGLDREEDTWQTLKEVLDTGMVGSIGLGTERARNVQDLVRSIEESRRGTVTTVSDWDVFDEPLRLRLYPESPGNNFLIDEPDGKIIELEEMDTRPDLSDNTLNRVVAIDGKYLSPKRIVVRNETVLKAYDLSLLDRAIDESLRRKALKEERDNLMESLRGMRDDIRLMLESNQIGLSTVLLMLSHLDEFEAKGFGFKRRKSASGKIDQYTFYVWTDEYVLKDFKSTIEHLYHFPRACIATRVRGNSVSRPHVINRYSHPFLSGYDRPNQSICTAGAHATRGDLYQKIIGELEIGINVMTGGYHARCGPYHRLSDPEFRSYRISANDRRIRSGELKITNEISAQVLARRGLF